MTGLTRADLRARARRREAVIAASLAARRPQPHPPAGSGTVLGLIWLGACLVAVLVAAGVGR